MSIYQFDQIISRYGTYSAKWDETTLHNDLNITPLSVADMDLPTAPEIIDAITKANNGIYGYTILGSQYQQTVANWLTRHHNFFVNPEDIVHCPRVIQGISIFLNQFTKEGDNIGIFTPSYAPIMNCISLNKRCIVPCELIYQNYQYQINTEKLESCFQKIKVFILISPHNPTGIVWNKEQLKLICQLAEKYQVFIISDEVHADFVFDTQHLVIAKLSSYVAEHSMICTSLAKTFNIPGLEISNLVIKNEQIRTKFQQTLIRFGFHNPNYFSIPAFYTAYTQCDQWLLELKQYIAKNKQIVADYFSQYLPQLKIIKTQGTYLMWINYADLALTPAEFKQVILQQANIELSWGEDFGQEGKYFFRLNVALPQKSLLDCLNRIHLALTTYKGD